MTRRLAKPTSPDAAEARRQALADTSAGVTWCHHGDTRELEALLRRGGFDTHPRIRRIRLTITSRNDERVLATDVARGLGADPAAAGRARSEVTMAQLVPLLLEHQTSDLLLGNAWWAQPRPLEELTVATRAAGVRLWLLGGDPLNDQWKQRLHSLGQPASVDDVVQAFTDIPHQPSPVPPAETGTHPWTRLSFLPTSDFVTFLADVRAQLTPTDAGLVEQTLREEHTLAATWLHQHPTAGLAELADALQTRWQTCRSWTHFLTRLRGWQIAAFHTGRLLKVDPAQIAGTARTQPGAAQRTVEQWDTLRAWHDPSRPAACALLAADIGSVEAAALTLNQVSADGATVTSPHGTTTTIEEGARRYLRMQLHKRHLDAAADDDPLLVGADGQPLSYRWLVKQANEARDTFGLPLSSSRISTRTTDGDRWAGNPLEP